MRLWRSLPEERRADPVSRDKVTAMWTDAEVLRLTNLRATQNRKAGIAGPEGSVSKLAFAEVNKRIYELAVNLMGPDGVLIDTYEFVRPEAAQLTGGGDPRKMFLRSRARTRSRAARPRSCATSWASGCSGFRASPATDKALPWKDVPRVLNAAIQAETRT